MFSVCLSVHKWGVPSGHVPGPVWKGTPGFCPGGYPLVPRGYFGLVQVPSLRPGTGPGYDLLHRRRYPSCGHAGGGGGFLEIYCF